MQLKAMLALFSVVAMLQAAPDPQFFIVGKYRLAYHSFGSGQTFVLLAGGPGMNPRYVAPIAAALARRDRRIVLFDQRGTGSSAPAIADRSRQTIAGAVADLDALREKLGEPKLALIGHSWGGMLAMAYAAAHPDRVRALILIDPGPMDASEFDRENVTHRAAQTMAERKAIRVAVRGHDLARAYELDDAANFFDHGKFGLVRASVGNQPLYNFAILKLLGPQLAHFDVRREIRVLDAPIDLVFGRADPGYFGAAQIRALNGSARLATIERAGHYPWLEQPKATYAALNTFLATISPARPDRNMSTN